VPNLLPYYGNRLGVGVEDFPIEYTLTETERLVGPPFRGGAVVTFPARRLQAFTGHVVVERGGETTIPAYGRLTLAGSRASYESPIAEDGEVYLENVPAGRYPAVIEHKQTTCRTTVDVPASDQVLVELGAIRCVAR
jgi:outer membrane usher protein